MLKPIVIFFIVYFWISAIVYADTRINLHLPCELERMGMMDNDKRNPGCDKGCLLYTSPSPRDGLLSRMPSSA